MAGQIIEKKNNRFMVRVYMGLDTAGKRKYHNETIVGKKNAQAYLNKKLHEKDIGTFSITEKLILEKHFENWFEVIKNTVCEKTFHGYKDLFRLHVTPKIGKTRLDKLKSEQIQLLYNEMTMSGLSPRTVRYTHKTLKTCLNKAVKCKLISENPAANVALPKQKQPENTTLTPEQASKLMQEIIYSPMKAFFSLMLTSGMRPSEALGLKWPDIDFDHDKITVARTLNRSEKGGGWTLEGTKTDRSRRCIPLPKTVINDLKELKQKQDHEAAERKAAEKWGLKENKVINEYKEYGFVFAAKNGEPMCRRNIIKRHFKPLLKSAELPNIRLYDLRHTCATLLLAAGVNPKIVSERLGHSSIVLTLDTYSHVLPDMQQGCADQLENILFR